MYGIRSVRVVVSESVRFIALLFLLNVRIMKIPVFSSIIRISSLLSFDGFVEDILYFDDFVEDIAYFQNIFSHFQTLS